MAATFEAIISISDKTSGPVQKIQERIASFGKATEKTAKVIPTVEERLQKLETAAEKAGVKMSPLDKALDHLSPKLAEAKSKFGELGRSVGEFGAKAAEIFPMLAGLGAVGSIGGIFELAHHFAESAEALDLVAQKVGISTAAVQRLDFAAKMTGLDTDTFNTGLTKLNKNLGAAAVGKDKDLAALLAKLHVSLRDTKGNVIDAAGALPALEKAFNATHSAALKAYIAQLAFGKSGLDMIPFLNQGPQKIAELQAEFSKLGYTPTALDKVNAGNFIDSWKKLETAVGGFTDELGAKLTPVLTPILSAMTDWISANREWINTDIGKAIQYVEDKFESWFKQMGGIKGIKSDLISFSDKVKKLAAFAGGLATAGEDVYAGWKDITGFFAGIAKDIDGLIEKIQALDSLMHSGGHYIKQGDRQIFVPDKGDQAGSPDEKNNDQNGHYVEQGRRKIFVPNLTPPPLKAASDGASNKTNGKVDVALTFTNPPPGMTAQATSSGNANVIPPPNTGKNGTLSNWSSAGGHQ